MKNFKKIRIILIIFLLLFAALTIADIVSARAGRSSSSSSRSYSKSSSSSSKSYSRSSSSSYSSKSYSSSNKSSSYSSSYNKSYGSGNYNTYKSSNYSSGRPSSYSGGYGSYPYSAPLIRRSFFGFTRENNGGSYSSRSSYGGSYGSSNHSGDGSFGVEGWIGLIILIIMFRLFIAFITWIFRGFKYVISSVVPQFQNGAGVYNGQAGLSPAGYSGSFAGISGLDGNIRNEDIELRVKEVFFKVQKAWTERDQRIASDCMSPRLYEKHKFDTDEMITNNEINILENLRLIEVRIIELNDGPAIGESSRSVQNCGRLSAYIRASAVDYIIDASTRDLIEGDRNASEEFVEIWKFLKGPEDWIVDEIIVKE